MPFQGPLGLGGPVLTPWLGKVLAFARVLFKLLEGFSGIIEAVLSDVAGLHTSRIC